MAPHKNGKKVPPYRHTQAELRIRLIWLTLKTIFECLCQYGRYIWEQNPLKVLSRRHRRLYFVENYGEMMIKPKIGERVLDLLLTGSILFASRPHIIILKKLKASIIDPGPMLVANALGNTFVRKKVMPRYDTAELIYFDIQCGEEGTFYVTFVPRIAGMHAVAVKWQNHHVENSPFRIKVYKASNVSTKNLKGAQEKRVIYDSLSLSSHSADGGLDHTEGVEEIGSPSGHGSTRSISAIAKAKAYSKGRQLTVTRRRVLRRIITRNGEDIVIEEAISPSLSRQSSITDNSDEDVRHHRQEKDTVNIGDTLSVKSKATILGTVPEERRGSKESEHSNSIDQSSQVVKYKCTELDEHNRLDDNDRQNVSNYEKPKAEDLTRSQSMTEADPRLFEKYARNAGVVAKRSILKRTSSIHHPYKPPAQRASSDGLVYKVRRGLVSTASCDLSDTSSEVSSEDRKGGHILIENGATSPTLKLVHSTSMKKACVYISEKAVHQATISSGGDSESTTDDMTDICTSLPGKTKLRATQSLPIMRKYWKRDMTSEDSVNGLIRSLQKICSLNSLPVLEKRSTAVDNNIDIDSCLTNNQTKSHGPASYENETMPETPVTSSTGTDQRNSTPGTDREQPIQETQNKQMFNFGSMDMKAYKADTDTCIKISENISEDIEESATENQVPDTPSGLSQRGNLTRQTKIFCRKSSADSSSVKTDHSSEEKVSTSQGSETKGRHFRAFRRIYIHSDEENNVVGKKEVTVIIPKAKVDKCTQVIHSDISRETGWDLIEGVYLLLRKISINLPCEVSDNLKTRPMPLALPVADNRCNENYSAGNALPDKHRLQVPLSPRDEEDYPPRRHHRGTGSNVSESFEVRDQQELLRRENHRNVNAWFERNNQLNSPNRLAPVRQFTMETIDSGFDDSQTLANYNRQGRLSLPNVLSGNGHVRLHRRPYRGPQITLAPSLVNSNSSQSVSLEHREAGNEADDELALQNIQTETTKQSTRRRRKRINRADSFSLSDSELHERRKRMSRKNLSFDHTASTNDSFVGKRKEFSGIMKTIMMEKTVLGKFREKCTESPNEVDKPQEDSTLDGSKTASKINIKGYLKHGSETLTSVDNNYHGFGVSKTLRNDFLLHVNGFKNLCLSEETSDKLSSSPKITHWQDENVFIPYRDDNAEMHENGDFLCGRHTSETSENESDMQLSPGARIQNQNTYDFTGKTVVDENQNKQSKDSSHLAIGSTSQGMIRSSTYFDMFSSFDHTNLHSDVEPSNIAMLGDVISLATTSGEQTIFRLAGAGLRYGTVGENNSFQVWVENPTPGSLTVTISGPQPHSVTETSVIYTGDNLYEVSYEVAHPGQYRIYVRWGERQLLKDPYISEVTI